MGQKNTDAGKPHVIPTGFSKKKNNATSQTLVYNDLRGGNHLILIDQNKRVSYRGLVRYVVVCGCLFFSRMPNKRKNTARFIYFQFTELKVFERLNTRKKHGGERRGLSGRDAGHSTG